MKRLSLRSRVVCGAYGAALFTLCFGCAPDESGPRAVGPSSRVALPPPIAPDLSALDPEVAEAVQIVLGDAQSVGPIMPWESASLYDDTLGADDGITLYFEDLFGNAFAYVNHVSRETAPTGAEELWLAFDPDAPPPSDERSWEHATYVSGATTRRSPLGSYFYGFPVLEGIYGDEARDDGIEMGRIERFVMPVENVFWAELDDGSYYDLLAHDFVDPQTISELEIEYAEILLTVTQNVDAFRTTAKQQWSNVAERVPVEVSACSGEQSNCISQGELQPRAYESFEECRKKYFLFWSWTECDDEERGWLDSTNAQAAKLDYQFEYEGKSNGCGPSSGASLLWWWEQRGGYDTLVDGHVSSWLHGDPAYEQAAVELVNDMEAFGKIFYFFDLPGGQRATWPGKYRPGLQKYLDRRGVPLAAKSKWGWAPLQVGGVLAELRKAFDRPDPRPVVALEGSLSVQHFGMLKGFRKDAFGGLWGDLLQPLGPRTALRLDGFFSLAGIYWIEEK